jgi:hypothetical protein
MHRLALSALLVALLPLCAVAQGTADTTQFVRISPAIGVHYGMPLKASLAAGGLFEVSAGYFRTQRFGQGYSLRLAGIRTGEKPWGTSVQTTYLGAEAHWMFLIGFGGRAGWFRRISANDASDPRDNLGTLGLSIGW